MDVDEDEEEDDDDEEECADYSQQNGHSGGETGLGRMK